MTIARGRAWCGPVWTNGLTVALSIICHDRSFAPVVPVSTTEHNGGADTLITPNDGSTILLKGVSHFPSSFFS